MHFCCFFCFPSCPVDAEMFKFVDVTRSVKVFSKPYESHFRFDGLTLKNAGSRRRSVQSVSSWARPIGPV
jgi:hypothetical protein